MKKTSAAAILFAAIFATTLTACDSPGPRYRNAASFSEGLAAVQTAGGRWGYINSNGVMVIPARYEGAKDFKDGRAAVKFNGRWGFINRKGEWL